jgi:Ser/Thr protein kinase RdoA (MazF antagonist)
MTARTAAGSGLVGYVHVVRHRPPTSDVLTAFGAGERPVPLDGGQRSSWMAGDLVLKPLDLGELELEWQAGLLASVHSSGFRLAHPRRAANGSLVVDGWCAWERVEGRHEARRWPEIIAAGERFHAAIADIPRPEFIAQRTDSWAIGDAVAWGDLPVSEFGHVKHLARLSAALRPVHQPRQLIHGDLTGNVLFADDLPPAIHRPCELGRSPC